LAAIGIAFLAVFAAAMVGSPNAKRPVCDVKVNGSDNTVIVPYGFQNITIDYDIQAGDYAGVNCDACLVMVKIIDYVAVGYWSYVLDPPYQVSGVEPFFTGALTDMNGSASLTFPPSLKKIILAVDEVGDGVINEDDIVAWDHVMVRVIP